MEAGWAERGFAESAKGLLLPLGMAVAGTALVTWLRARKRPRGALPRKHARDGWAVEILGFDKGSTRIRLYSLAFAKALLELNPALAKRG